MVLFELSRASFSDAAALSSSGAPRRANKQEGDRGALPLWTLRGCLRQSSSRTRDEVAFAVHQALGSLFPWLRAGDARAFSTVPTVCAALSSKALPRLKPRFALAKTGLPLDAFVELLFKQLALDEPRLSDPNEASGCVALLQELFRQIDINGDQKVDWEEFTNYTISAGMRGAEVAAGLSQRSADEFDVHYELDRSYDLSDQPHASIHLVRHVPELKRLLVVRKDAAAFDAYDRLGRWEHAYRFGTDSSTTTASDAATSAGGVVHDLVYVPERQVLVAALSDHTMHLLKEQLASNGGHRTYKSAGVIVTHALHRKLCWSTTADRLFSVCTYSKLHTWCLETAVKAQKAAHPAFSPHSDILTDLIFIKEKGLLATSGLDKVVKLWGIENLRCRGVLKGHALGVRCVAYAQSVLVSGGFDNKAIVWDVTSHEMLCVLDGHKHALCHVSVVAPNSSSIAALTLDDDGAAKYWTLENHGAKPTCVEAFRLPFRDPAGPTRCCARPANAEYSVDDWPDLFFGGSKLYHVVPRKTCREFAPPSTALYNQTSRAFVCCVGDCVHCWDARTTTPSGNFAFPSKARRRPSTRIICVHCRGDAAAASWSRTRGAAAAATRRVRGRRDVSRKKTSPLRVRSTQAPASTWNGSGWARPTPSRRAPSTRRGSGARSSAPKTVWSWRSTS